MRKHVLQYEAFPRPFLNIQLKGLAAYYDRRVYVIPPRPLIHGHRGTWIHV